MRLHGIDIPAPDIAEFCRRHAVRRLSLFGSVLRESFRADSDVDVLVEFEPGRTPGYFGFAGMALELEKLMNRRVDLRTPEDLSFLFRDRVQREAIVVHAA